MQNTSRQYIKKNHPVTVKLKIIRAHDLELGNQFYFLGYKYFVRRITAYSIWYDYVDNHNGQFFYFGIKSNWFVELLT